MPTQQPEWKCVGSFGDVDPIAYGGGFIYEDTTGVYAPEVTLFIPGSDEKWKEKEGKTPLEVRRFIIERTPQDEWWWDKRADLAGFMGGTVAEFEEDAVNGSLRQQANIYQSIGQYYGFDNFDAEPRTMTEDEAYEKYKEEMTLWAHQTTVR
jgi:hypothetical protein